tara:strand:+ start:403 stop:1440 length:1038 start_codon:yes stop_codon:yes gene_type:complete
MKFFRLVLPGLGLLFLGYLIGHLGPDEILRNFLLMKWTFPFILLLACSWHITNSIAWSFAFPPGAFRPRLRTLFMAKLAGDAVSQLTPLANIGGEPLKAYLLKGESPTSRGLASVVINKTAQVITGLFFTAVGLSLIFLYWNLPQAIPLPIRVGLGILLFSAALLIALLYRKQKHMFSSLLHFLQKCGVRTTRLERKMAKAVSIDAGISQFYAEHKLRFFAVMFFHSVGWLLGACETYLILRGLGADIDFAVAFLITSLTLIINSLFFFMPSNIGVLEGGQVFLLATLGLNPALGLSLGIVKRMRKIFWISVGWLFLTRLSRNAWQEEILATERAEVGDPLLRSM